MAFYYNEPSRTFSEYLLLPNLTTKDCTPDKVSLRTPIVRYKAGENSALYLNIPLASAIMQAVSDHRMAIELARCGGISFIYASQPIEDQAEMVRKVKSYKAGFVQSDSNLRPDHTLRDVIALTERTGHSTIAITEDGTANGKLVGIVTSRDYRPSRTPLDTPVRDFMTPFSEMVYGMEGITLSEANDLIWEHKLNCLPIIDQDQKLRYLVFRKDYTAHKENPLELLDAHKRLVVGAGGLPEALAEDADHPFVAGRERRVPHEPTGRALAVLDRDRGVGLHRLDGLALVRGDLRREVRRPVAGRRIVGAGRCRDGTDGDEAGDEHREAPPGEGEGPLLHRQRLDDVGRRGQAELRAALGLLVAHAPASARTGSSVPSCLPTSRCCWRMP